MEAKRTSKKATSKMTASKTTASATSSPSTSETSSASAPKTEPASKSAVKMPTIQRGDRGPAVRRAQALLNLYGRSSLKLDGIFLAQTESAVEEHQGDHQLPISGKVDDKTWRHLLTSKL